VQARARSQCCPVTHPPPTALCPTTSPLPLDVPGDGVDPFASVRQKWNSQLETDKEVCAVLAAVTESIREQGGEETSTAFWGVLMTTLEGADADKDEMAIAAVVRRVVP
jgi:hypothetical protein